MKIKNIKFEYRIVFLYLIIGILWIYFSDSLFDIIIPDKETQTKLSIAKGFFFIITTSILLYGFIKRHNSKLREAQNQIIQQNNELQAANKRLKEAKEKSQESDRLKTAFIQNMSHEIRTPMNGIIGFSELLSKEGITDEKKKLYTKIISENSRQLLTIVTDIITISTIDTKQQKLNLSEIDVNLVLKNCYDIFAAGIRKKGLDFKVTLLPEDDSAKIIIDETKLTQIISNLLSNATKFTDEGYILFGCLKKDQMLEFFVEDSGIGIAPENQQKIFHRFTQGDLSPTRTHGGNGLGLSISKAFSDLMDGEITVSSEPGKGARFSLLLQYRPVAKSSTTHPKNHGAFKIKTPFTILVAEDEENNFLLIKEILSAYTIQTIHARDGNEAIRLCDQHPEIDLVLMDIKMPNMDGYNAAKVIKKKRKNLPVIAQTVYALGNEIEQYENVFDDYITKPIEPDKLDAILNNFSTKKKST